MGRHHCGACEKSFGSADALDMHNKAKHPETYKKPLLTTSQKKRVRNWTIALGVMGLMIWGFVSLFNGDASDSLDILVPAEKAAQIPLGEVHWHPMLTILIDAKRIPIPPDIGYGTGKIVDAHLSGMRMSPTHTHESDGTIHIENNNPIRKPETVTLGYFFYVWGKMFNSTCIFEYCTDKGTLTMTVNGKKNDEFGNYIMQDKDQIRIEYKSFDGELQQ